MSVSSHDHGWEEENLFSLDRALSISFLLPHQLDNKSDKDPTQGQALKISPEPHPVPVMVPSAVFQAPISGCSLAGVVGGSDTTPPGALCVSPPQMSVGTLVFLSPKLSSPSARWVFSSFLALLWPDGSRSRDNLSCGTNRPHLGVVRTHLFLSLERPDYDHKREERNFGRGALLRLAECRFVTVSGEITRWE